MGDLSKAEAGKARRFAQPVLRLDKRAVSPQAYALVSHVLEQIVWPSLPPQRPSSVPRIREALEATLGGLIEALGAEWGDGWLRRPMANDSFSGEPVGRTVFHKTLRALVNGGLVEILEGKTGGGPTTRVRLTQAGIEAAQSFKVTQGDIGQHFAETEALKTT